MEEKQISKLVKRLNNTPNAMLIIKGAIYLEKTYGENVVALLAYGSLVFGKPRKNSVPDYLLIAKDIVAFHQRNENYYRTGLTKPSSVHKQIVLNSIWPNFYHIKKEDLEMKLGVMSISYLQDAIRQNNMFVQGRLQKPLGVLWSCKEVDNAILLARENGTLHALNLLQKEFRFREFAEVLASLSYKAEIRPENTNIKVKEIVDAGFNQFKKIYLPIIENIPYIVCEKNGLFIDTRTKHDKAEALKQSLDFLHKQKWAWKSITRIYQNAMNYKNPLQYILAKVKGEIKKKRKK